jgi:hypothetical protein
MSNVRHVNVIAASMILEVSRSGSSVMRRVYLAETAGHAEKAEPDSIAEKEAIESCHPIGASFEVGSPASCAWRRIEPPSRCEALLGHSFSVPATHTRSPSAHSAASARDAPLSWEER